MRSYIQTRGRSIDYGFLGAAPAAAWWTDFSRYTAFENATILINSKANHWKIYVGGVNSTRRDRSNRIIKYTIVMEGSAASSSEHKKLALGIVSAWLEDIGSDNPSGLVGQAFDEQFAEEVVERLMIARRGHSREVDDRLRAALRSLAESPLELVEGRGAAYDPVEMDSWVGGVYQKLPRALFVHRAKTLLHGGCGGAFFLNSLSEQEAGGLAEKYGAVAVLLDDRNESIGPNVIPVAGQTTTSPDRDLGQGPGNGRNASSADRPGGDYKPCCLGLHKKKLNLAFGVLLLAVLIGLLSMALGTWLQDRQSDQSGPTVQATDASR